MSKKYSLSERALSDVIDFHQYLIEENGHFTAERFITGIFKKFGLLATFPGMGRDREDLSPGLYSFPDIRYKRSIFYEKRTNGVFIVRVLGGYQDHNQFFINER